jgi:hypothetical protein
MTVAWGAAERAERRASGARALSAMPAAWSRLASVPRAVAVMAAGARSRAWLAQPAGAPEELPRRLKLELRLNSATVPTRRTSAQVPL